MATSLKERVFRSRRWTPKGVGEISSLSNSINDSVCNLFVYCSLRTKTLSRDFFLSHSISSLVEETDLQVGECPSVESFASSNSLITPSTSLGLSPSLRLTCWGSKQIDFLGHNEIRDEMTDLIKLIEEKRKSRKRRETSEDQEKVH